MRTKLIKPFATIFACLLLCSNFVKAETYAGEDALKPLTSFENGWFTVYKIKDNVYAIGEIQYYQGNYSYLIVGKDRALMLDSGATTTKDITKVVKSLTDKPISVLPTHLHFDHIGGLSNFKDIWLLDTPQTRSFKRSDGLFYIPDSYTLGFIDEYDMKPVKVSKLIKPNEEIDLGGVKIKVIPANGHNPDESVIYDMTNNILFTGDYIYPGFLLNSNTDLYLASTNKVLSLLNKDTRIFGGHTSSKFMNVVPEVKQSDVADLKAFLIALKSGKLKGEEIDDSQYKIKKAIYYPINDRLSFITDIIWDNGAAYKY